MDLIGCNLLKGILQPFSSDLTLLFEVWAVMALREAMTGAEIIPTAPTFERHKSLLPTLREVTDTSEA